MLILLIIGTIAYFSGLFDSEEDVVEKDTAVKSEKLVKNETVDNKVEKIQQDTDTLRLQNQLTEKTGARVIINHQKSGKGKLVFSYTTLEELEGIIARIN